MSMTLSNSKLNNTNDKLTINTESLNSLCNKNSDNNYGSVYNKERKKNNNSIHIYTQPKKPTNFLITKNFLLSDIQKNEFLSLEEKNNIKRLTKLLKVNNSNMNALLEESKNDFILHFKNYDIPKITQKTINVEKRDSIFPILSKMKNNNLVFSDYIIDKSYNSLKKINEFSDFKIKEKIKKNIEETIENNKNIVNGMNLIEEKFNNLKKNQEIKNFKQIGVEYIKEHDKEEEHEEEQDSDKIINEIFEKVKKKHLQKDKKYKKIVDDLQNSEKNKKSFYKNLGLENDFENDDYNSVRKSNQRCSYETWVSYKNPKMEINQKISQENMVNDIRILNEYHEFTKKEFIKFNFGEDKNKPKIAKKLLSYRKSIFNI